MKLFISGLTNCENQNSRGFIDDDEESADVATSHDQDKAIDEERHLENFKIADYQWSKLTLQKQNLIPKPY